MKLPKIRIPQSGKIRFFIDFQAPCKIYSLRLDFSNFWLIIKFGQKFYREPLICKDLPFSSRVLVYLGNSFSEKRLCGNSKFLEFQPGRQVFEAFTRNKIFYRSCFRICFQNIWSVFITLKSTRLFAFFFVFILTRFSKDHIYPKIDSKATLQNNRRKKEQLSSEMKINFNDHKIDKDSQTLSGLFPSFWRRKRLFIFPR